MSSLTSFILLLNVVFLVMNYPDISLGAFFFVNTFFSVVLNFFASANLKQKIGKWLGLYFWFSPVFFYFLSENSKKSIYLDLFNTILYILGF